MYLTRKIPVTILLLPTSEDVWRVKILAPSTKSLVRKEKLDFTPEMIAPPRIKSRN